MLKPVPHLLNVTIRDVPASHIFVWLQKGFFDAFHSSWLSLAHGVVLAAFGALLFYFAGHQFWLLAGAFSGFMVMSPILATSLYAISRDIELGRTVSIQTISNTWLNWQLDRSRDPNSYWCLIRFGILLGAAATTWVLSSAAFITLVTDHPINTPKDFILHVVLADKGIAFELWLMLGGLLAAPIFASSAISIPLLLDKQVKLWQAVEVSWRCVLANPGLLASWAAVLMLLTLIGMATFLVGLIIVIPVLGHASWHAYKELIDSSQIPFRQQL